VSEVSRGDTVRIHYTGRLDDGTVFDTSQQRGPLEFVAGGDQVIRGVSEGVLGMNEGEKKTVTVPPEQAYGERSDDMRESVPREQLPQDVNEGDWLTASRGDQQFPVRVEELSENEAKLDLNHPLAGKELHFDIEIVDVERNDQ
jgi:peptidylprolyl isomerase